MSFLIIIFVILPLMPTRDFSEGITADFENSIVIYNVQVSGGYHKLQSCLLYTSDAADDWLVV